MDRPHWRKNLFKRVLTDQKFLLTTWAPQEFRRPSLSVPLVLAIAGAAGSTQDDPGLDHRLSESISTWSRANTNGAAQAITVLGDGAAGIVLVGGTYLIARWGGKTRLRRASSLSAEAMLDAAIWSTTLKSLTRRARPGSAVGGNFLVNDPGVKNTSFPSGHAMGSFAVAAVFAGAYPEKRWVPWVAYGAAGLVALSRVALDRHYFSDVVVGGLLGRSLGRMVMARENGTESEKGVRRWEPIFDPVDQNYGLGYRYTW